MSEPLAVREAPAKYQVVLESQRVRPGYKQTEVGVIPEDWKQATIGEVAAKVGSGMTPRGGSSKYKEYGRPFVRSQNIGWGRLLLGDIAYIDDETHSTFSATELKENDVLLNITGASIGRSALADQNLVGGNVNQHVCIIRSNPNDANPSFINYLLLSSLGQRQIDSFQAGGNREGLNFGQIRSIKLPLPPTKAEQEAIAEALSDADALIKALEQLIAKKRHLKQGAMQELLTGKKRLPGFIGEWEVKALGDLFNFSGGFSASRDQLSNDGHCYLHYGDIHKSSKTCIDVRSEYQDIPKLDMPLKRISSGSLLDDGDVVFVDASEDDEGTSKHVVIVNKDKTPYISGLHTIVAKSKADNMDHLYKRYCFQTMAIKQQFYFYAVGTKVSGISKTNIAKVMLPVPPLPEQTAIATILSDMDAEIAALEARLAKTRSLKQGMMHNLLTGKIRLV